MSRNANPLSLFSVLSIFFAYMSSPSRQSVVCASKVSDIHITLTADAIIILLSYSCSRLLYYYNYYHKFKIFFLSNN